MKTKKIVGIRVVAPGSDPDVDSDFNTMVREHAIEYVRDQYHNVASIVTFNTLKAAKAFKAMCTIYEVPFAAANKMSGLIPKPIEGVDCTISDLFDPSSDRYSEGVDFRNATAGDEWTKILKGAMAIENRNDSHGVHPCGIVISSQPLENVIPTHVRQSDGAVITQWHYSDLESMGLIKMDFLGLDTVDLIQHSVENVMALGKTPPNMIKLVHGPMDDKKTFELFSRGDTIGIFQMAGDGVRDLLRRIKPDDVEDIIATTALYRPGPMGMQSHTKYAARKNGQETIEYPVHPDFKGSKLEDILGKTFSLVVYQEQIIKIASEIAGMTLQEGDDLRKAMGKKKVAVMDKMRPKFFEGAKANGFSEAAVTELWDTIAEFAKYGFNRSHSVAYGINAYQAGYLKANYPVEFMAALIAQHVNNREKTLAHLQEAGRMGLRIGPADVNKSVTRVAPVADDPKYDILFGLGGVNSVSEDNADLIVKERTENGDFKSPQDFVRRMFNLGITNRRVFENIALAGGFDRMGFSRKGIVDALSDLIAGAKTTATKGASLFDLFGDADEMDSVAVKISNEMYPHVDMLKAEANVMGLYLSGHPLERARASLSASTDVHSIKELHNSSRSVQMTIVGAITNIETKIQRRGGKRITVSIDDGSGYLNANLHGSVVKAMDKLSAQTSVRRLWEKGATEISEELLAAAVNPEVTLPLEEIEKNDVYVMQVSYRPATELSDYYCRVDSIRKLRLSDDGTLPIRLRIMEKFRSEAGKLSAAIANASPGESEIWAAMIDGSELPLVIPNDEAYLQAGEEIRTGKAVLKESAAEKGARKITRIDGSVTEAKKKGRGAAKTAAPSNVWPPQGTEETTTLKIRAKADELYFFAADQLSYSVSKRTASASGAVLPIADKIVGREGIDFGFATPVMFSDKD